MLWHHLLCSVLGPSFGLSLYSANENLQSTPVASKSASNENMVCT